ncbi:glycosyltransferase family 4 protein [Leptolyngbya sp. O-77]|uniref:glycosyltransferase family 4 protein n=1 Tax=Leptolyngbya sp. O-77 TaxID=1080068 RepID=UPI00074D29CC|nr:glycosyltransferase family 4 protein [Leptolyngbya sp. O-77]BAU44000.1 D-inositol 3-phosphate glycosyltransferase [Leptolyngbya sp. O-77]
MKVLHISTSDLDGGAARAAYRLHKGLLKIGVESQMLVRAKLSHDRTVIAHKPLMAQVASKVDGLPLRRYPTRDRSLFSVQWFPDSIVSKVKQINPDIIHLHWTHNGFLQIESLAKFQKPLVWTLHDMWAFTGGCHYTQECDRYTTGCGTCPHLNSEKPKDLSSKVWQRKLKSWRELNITLVTPSQWMAKCVSRSPLFEHCQVKVIPNGLDTTIYKPIDKLIARQIFNLPPHKKLVLFGAGSTSSDPRKGFQFLIKALQKLDLERWRDELGLVIFGESQSTALPVEFETHYVGRLNDDVSLATAYAAADVFVAPSMQDNLPNTVLESFACGTPCVAFEIGGMPDMIDYYQNGYLAKPFEPEDLAAGIEWVLDGQERWEKLSGSARRKAVESFSETQQVQDLMRLYPN